MCYIKHIILLVCLFLGSLSLSAQSAKQGISGILLDADQKIPLPNVSIELLNFYPIKIVQTDIDGRFVIPDLPSGKYKLLFQKKGYEDFLIDVRVVAGQVTAVNHNLKKSK